MQAFPDKDIAKRYLNLHYNHFVTRDDIETLAKNGVTHVRVPLGHWILGDVTPEEPYVHASGWLYFVRLVGWCRSLGIQVWPDLHTAPGCK
jgi:glucan 1,3-beta-glucosidase